MEIWEGATAVLGALGLREVPAIVGRIYRRRQVAREKREEAQHQEEVADRTALTAEVEAHGETKAELAGLRAQREDLAARNDELSNQVQNLKAQLKAARESHAEELSQAMRLVIEEAERKRNKR